MWFSSDYPALRQRLDALTPSPAGRGGDSLRLLPHAPFWWGARVAREGESRPPEAIHLAEEPLWSHLLTEQVPAWRFGSEQRSVDFWHTPPRAILFDLDGTLIDSFDGILDLFLAVLADMNRGDVGDEAVRPLIGRPLDDCFACFLSGEDVSRAADEYRTRYAACMLDISPPFPGTEALLRQLRAEGVKVGVVSNKRASAVRGIVEGHGWDVDIVYGEGEGVRPKPSPDLILAALDALDLRPEQALYVGDSTLDGAAARAAGTPFVALTTGAHDARELAVDACGSFPSVAAFARGLGFASPVELPRDETA